MDYESVLLVKNEVFVYRIPPRPSNRGYRANDWNLEAPMWTVRLRVVSKGKDLVILLEDKNSGQLFAKCPVDSFPGISVEPVLDSSRYFVIRLVSNDGRTTFTGIGFTERSDSFDLNVAIQDHFKWLKQEKEAEEMEKIAADQPAINMAFKQGEKIKLNLNTRRTGDEPNQKSKVSRPIGGGGLSGGGGGSGLLPPPPPPAISRSRGSRTTTTPTTTTTGETVNFPTSFDLVSSDSQQSDNVLSMPTSNNPTSTNTNTTTSTNATATATSNMDLLNDIFGNSGQF
ncbi:unnamed protein product [Trichobilharzia szidati]|nr:unnamed protein product [Trichobilharzia szidati]